MADCENGTEAKRLKTQSANECETENASDNPVSDLEITRVLRESAREKNIFIHGKVRG